MSYSQSEINELVKTAIPFTFPISEGIVCKVYDGDTITILSKLPYESSPLYKISVRINGINCAEIKGKTDDEKQCAQIAKNELSNMILNRRVELKNVRSEKYGRMLADVYIGDINISDHLIKAKLAVSYDGGTKICPKNWMNYYLHGEFE